MAWAGMAALALAVAAQAAPPYDPSFFGGLRWRCIGPFRGGRTVAAVGVRGARGLFYIGVNDGGVWKTTDFGRTWAPIFDDQPTGSIGAIAVAPSDPRILYVGSGEGLQRPDLSVGDGIYRSADGGRTWSHLGLRDGQQIPALAVDPHDPNRVFAAVLGHPYGPNHERGVFRSTDGGVTWENVLFKGDDTGAMDVLFDPSSVRTLYAVMWSARQPPWEGSGGSWTRSENNGLFKSVDGGTTWRKIGAGLPSGRDSLGRIGITIAPGRPQRLYAVLGAKKGGGLYRSEDGGEHFSLVNADHRLWDRDGDFNEVKVDARDPDVVYVANVVTWKSTDGGRTFIGWRGAPGGDDYHRLWIDPDDPKTILLAGDQGAIVTVNGGATWSSWYNQPTAQLYHVSADNAFPYRVYGGQQESGSAGVLSRGSDGAITDRDWHPVGAEEYGYVAADPLDPDIVFGGKLSRFDWKSRDVQNVTPDPLRAGDYRWVRTMPVLFSPLDPHVLYTAANVIFETRDGGHAWRTISPDLTRASDERPANVGTFAPLDAEGGKHRGVVYTIAPSFKARDMIWAGTDDGLIHVTRDGGRSWRDVTPPSLTSWSKVSLMEASHFDTATCYAAINRLRLDDTRPHVLRTRDGGRTWTEIVAGIPANEMVNAVREDPVVRGLLYAASERTVYVSFDDGDHWQSLRLNLPASSVRDVVVHENDLVIGTHGRSFWILDDIAPLQQIAAAAAAGDAYLHRPSPAWRVRWNRNTDTPVPPDEPAGQNPPDGAILDYRLAHDAAGPAVLEILDARGQRVRRYSSADPPDTSDTDLNIPTYWIRRPMKIATSAGTHRFIWDLHGEPPAATRRDYPISAVYAETPREPRGPWALPGAYTVRLTVDGRTLTQPLTVRMDPRVHATSATLEQQWTLATRLAAAMAADTTALGEVRAMRRGLKARRAGAEDSTALDALDREAAKLETGAGAVPVAGRAPESLARLNGELRTLYLEIEGSDQPPTAAIVEGVTRLEVALEHLRAQVVSLGTRVRAGTGR
ncbi:MAG: glycoside hydrolase [Candidatus Eisenbacteria bacterium]|uniref:Glycoside hydrolase n=1 Tax=Eiseniibacteriota bacterium TaxID=2212470 RepID=A0A9D6L4U4_UNCEI|nr:glycoside hydrolase [Candidatus Eisenbacteria bacterium]MBI3538811.1 glycoside hydrolase [Candidatus Eisenbacteria bacterium]